MRHSFLRRALAGLTLGAALVLGAPHADASTKIAVVDTQRAIMETEDGLRAAATLKKLFDSRQRDLDKKQNELQKEREDIEKQQNVLSKQAIAARVEKWQREMAQLQALFVEYNKELQKKQDQLTRPVFQKCMGIIQRMAKRDGYDVVIDKQAVPYVRSDLDLTDRVITAYNQGDEGGESGKSDKGDKAGKGEKADKDKSN
ncbi:MAG: OmpH family outer membrane protein [Polyangiaceae bacterium]|nr:OmpH family outer membrane protein [Polyangiaceae bacterium]